MFVAMMALLAFNVPPETFTMPPPTLVAEFAEQRAVGDRHRATVVVSAAAVSGGIAGERAVGDRHGGTEVVNAAAAVCGVAGAACCW